MAHKPDPMFQCLDCDIDTSYHNEFYMIHDALWKEIVPDIDGKLCIGCAEKRLGRKLKHTDFIWCHVNIGNIFHGSKRLRNRIGAKKLNAAFRVAWFFVNKN